MSVDSAERCSGEGGEGAGQGRGGQSASRGHASLESSGADWDLAQPDAIIFSVYFVVEYFVFFVLLSLARDLYMRFSLSLKIKKKNALCVLLGN